MPRWHAVKLLLVICVKQGVLIMSMVSLREVVEEMNIISDEHSAYLNKRTGELVTLSREELPAA